jgi:peptidase S41-like protein
MPRPAASKARAKAAEAKAAAPAEALAAQRGPRLTDALATAGGGRRRAALGAAPAGTGLDGAQRLEVVDTLAAVLAGAYCHLPQKRAGYAVDPVQALALLRRQCVELTDGEFHLAVTGLVTDLRDAHTRYVGPAALGDQVATLGFLVERYGPDRAPRFLVSKVAEGAGIDDPGFVPGVELEWWNGIPFARAVDLYASRETGGRPDARRARALESLTFRALRYGPPPDEHRVDIGYRTRRGAARELRVPWRVVDPGRAASAVRPGSAASLKLAANLAAEAVRGAKQLLFAPGVWHADRGGGTGAGGGAGAGSGAGAAAPAGGDWLATSLPDALAARPLRTRRGRLGYLRIWSFDVDDDAFLDEVCRLLDRLPQRGLILDLRSNPGGLVWAAERLLQLFFGGERVVPTRFSLLASPMTRAMAASPFNRLELEPWARSLEDAVTTGELYSQPLPLTDPDWCNDLGRRYEGPVVAVVDANTYSAGDLFAAGFVDNRIGPLVCVGEATGAGGANVWTSAQLRDALAGTPHAFGGLPADIGFTISVRRAVRSGPADGVPIEDLGVAGIPYRMTRRDLLDGNRDLLEACAEVLALGT